MTPQERICPALGAQKHSRGAKDLDHLQLSEIAPKESPAAQKQPLFMVG